MHARGRLAIAAFVSCGAVRAAHAEPSDPLVLVWEGPPECPTASAVRAQVTRPPSSSFLRAHARVTKTETGTYTLLLTTEGEGGAGERSIEANDCEALAHTAALLLTLASEIAEKSENPEVSAPAPAPAPLVSAPAEAEDEPAAPRQVPPGSGRLAIFLAGAVDRGALPTTAEGAALAVAWRGHLLRLEASGALWLRQGAESSTSGASFARSSAAARACMPFEIPPFELGPCGALGLAYTTAQGHTELAGAATMREASVVGEAAVGGDAYWSFADRWGIRARLDAVVPTSRPRFVIDRGAERIGLHTPAPVGARAAIGVEAHFW